MKKRIFVFWIVIIVLLSFQNVYGDDWICIDRDDNGRCLYSYNKKIVRVSKNIVRVWGKKVITDEEKNKYKLFPEDESYSIVLVEIDCNKMTWKLLGKTDYNIDDSLSESFDFSDEKPMTIVPEGIEEIEKLQKIVCK